MTDKFNSIEEAYNQIAEALNFLSKRGETIILCSARPGVNAMISGFSGGVKWTPGKDWGQGWEAYEEG